MPGPFAFAWCGGTVVDQVLISTTGNTHGGQILTLSATGSVESGGRQLFNLAPAVSLEDYALYGIAGPGLPAGSLFIFDNSALSGTSGTINLSYAATASYTSATYTITKAVSFGTISATLTLDSATVTVPDDLDLASGTYQISGTNVGDTLAPPPEDDSSVTDDTMLVSGALINYNGDPTVDMFIYALVDDVVVAQDVTAGGSGEVPINLTGFADQDWYSITSIPLGVLADLVPGLRYNIAGNGLPVGATFVAPDDPATATSLILEQPATSATIGALLTITGPRTPDADFDPAVHNRFDEEVLSLTIAQEEGGFATLDVELKNPNVGLLALGRQLWVWLSWDQNWTVDGSGTPDLVPLFNGQLVGVPSLTTGETVTLQFRARPDDYGAQKSALVEDMKILPYWDAIWVAADVSQDTILETYSALWHVDRISLELTASDILEGEDGIVTIDETQSFYDAFSLTVGDAPLTAVTVSGTVEWQQKGDGTVEVTQKLVDAFAGAGSPYTSAFPLRDHDSGGGGLISTVNGSGLKSDWPKSGTSIGGGWSLTTRNDSSGKPLCYIEDSVQNGTFRETNYKVRFTGQEKPATSADQTDEANTVATYTASYGNYQASFPISVYKVRMVLQWRADRRRTETVAAVVTANVQRMLTDTADADAEDISLTSQYVGQGVDAGGEVPIGSLTKASYFQTDRGAYSFENMLLQARAKMRAKSRAIEIAFAVDWRTALTIGCRNSVTYSDRRIAGGAATGKVKSYKLTVADGVMLGEFVIGVAIGTGAASVGTVGEETYVESGYVDGWQVMAGGQDELIDAEMYYQSLDQFAIEDDGIDLTNLTVDTAVNTCFVTDGLIEQLDVLSQYQRKQAPTDGDPISAAVKLKTTVTLDLVPVAGSEFHTNFYPAVSMVALPQGIDLSASAGRARAV